MTVGSRIRRRVSGHRAGGGGGGDPSADIIYDANAITGLSDGDLILQLLDQSGNGNDTTGTGAALVGPTYDVDAFGTGRHGIRFGGAAWFQLPDLSALTEAELFVVIKIDADPPVSTDTSQHWDFQRSSGADSHYPWTDGVIYEHAGTSVRKTVGNPTPALTTARLYNVITTASEYTVNLDTAQIFTTATNTVSFAVDPRIGGQVRGGFLHAGMIGHYAEFRLYPIKRTSPERSAIEAALKSKWNLTGY